MKTILLFLFILISKISFGQINTIYDPSSTNHPFVMLSDLIEFKNECYNDSIKINEYYNMYETYYIHKNKNYISLIPTFDGFINWMNKKNNKK